MKFTKMISQSIVIDPSGLILDKTPLALLFLVELYHIFLANPFALVYL